VVSHGVDSPLGTLHTAPLFAPVMLVVYDEIGSSSHFCPFPVLCDEIVGRWVWRPPCFVRASSSVPR
jgi:hypothetical protein